MYFQGERENIVFWNTSLLFDSDEESAQSNGSDSDSDSGTERNHILSIEDEFILVLMKLRLGLANLDLTIRFRVSEATVCKNTIQCPWSGLEPGLFAPESRTPTMRPLHVPLH